MANAFLAKDLPSPTHQMIAEGLGTAIAAWDQLLALLSLLNIELTWKWYRDGGWLAKATKGSKTILWASIDDDASISGTFIYAGRLKEQLAEFPGVSKTQAHAILAQDGKSISVPFTLKTVADVRKIEPLVIAKLKLK